MPPGVALKAAREPGEHSSPVDLHTLLRERPGCLRAIALLDESTTTVGVGHQCFRFHVAPPYFARL